MSVSQSVHLSVRPSITFPVRAITYVLLSSLSAVTLTWSIPQRSKSHKTFKGQSSHTRVRAITYLCSDGLPSNLVQMLSSLGRCSYYPRIFRLLIKLLVFPIFPFLTSGSVQFAQVQGTSQVERKTKCSKRITVGDIAVLWTALFKITAVILNVPKCKFSNTDIKSSSIYTAIMWKHVDINTFA